MKRPASQFYWGDWLVCQELRAVSLAGRGLWIDMLCYMRQGAPIGHLTHRDGRPITPAQLARMVGDSPRVVERLLGELDRAGVPGKADNGAFTSRRMLRDEEEYQRYRAGQAEAGKRGAAERWGSPSPSLSRPHEKGMGSGCLFVFVFVSVSVFVSRLRLRHRRNVDTTSRYTHLVAGQRRRRARAVRSVLGGLSQEDQEGRRLAGVAEAASRCGTAAADPRRLGVANASSRLDQRAGSIHPTPSSYLNDARWEDEPPPVTVVSANTAQSIAARDQSPSARGPERLMTAADLPAFTANLIGLQELLGGPPFSETRLALYCDAVSDLPLDTLLPAIREAARMSTFFPKPAELRALAQGDTADGVERGWLPVPEGDASHRRVRLHRDGRSGARRRDRSHLR